jgi:hypothetical protein
MKHNRLYRKSPGKPRVSATVLDRINPNVAGIDCGAAEHFVAVPPERDPTPVQAFRTFTGDLLRLADWLATEKHFTSWLTLAPKNKISGGRLLSSRTQPSANRAAAILRMAAMSLGRTQTAIGAFYHRLAARIGKPQAITATARKLAILVYRTLKGELMYRDPGADAYDLQQRTRVLRRLRQRAATLGFELLNRETGEILPVGVS